MIRKVILTLDGSPSTKAVYDAGVWIGLGFMARVTGVHVIDVVALEGPILHDISGSLGIEPFLNFSTKMKEALTERGEEILKSAKESSVPDRIELDTRLLSGIVSREIIKAAEMSDLLIVGRRGVNAEFEYELLGSTTESIIRKAPVPVLVVPESFTAPTKPIICFDGGPSASASLKFATEVCKSLRLKPEVIVVGDDSDENGAMLKEAEDYIKSHKIDAKYTSLSGIPHKAIVDHAVENDIDAIFIGATHHSAIYEMVLGSTTEHVMRSLNVPFFVHRS
ncbi:MAG: universal stress protein [Deltaproteobacteria bacterium]|nr:universal stress protein [Deltaproteobacteria bacterium]